jgi:hypothetical protein
MKIPHFPNGTALVTDGDYKGRISHFDDNEDDMAICYFGSILMHANNADIPFKFLRPVTTDDLMKRKEEIYRLINAFVKDPVDMDMHLDLLYEFSYIKDILILRAESSQHIVDSDKGKRVFISYSSQDTLTAKWIYVDLVHKGHKPWLDKWSIKVGQSIPTEIGKGLDECDVVILLLSTHSVKSGWVEREWQAKYWDEVESGRVFILPVLLEDCKIPKLLKMKKYTDFREDYSEGIWELAKALL